MSTTKKVAKILVSVLLWAIILLAALYAFVTLATKDPNNLSSVGGMSPLTIQSNSMAPTFEKGDLIIIKQVDPAELKEGDIISFHTIIDNKYAINTHRIAKIIDENGYREYVTKGDNNTIEDANIIRDGDIAGKYLTHIPKLGALIDFLSSKVGFFIIIVLPLLAFFVYQVYHLIMITSELKKATAIETALEQEELKQKADSEEAARMMEEAKRMQAEAEEALAKAKALQEKDKE